MSRTLSLVKPVVHSRNVYPICKVESLDFVTQINHHNVKKITNRKKSLDLILILKCLPLYIAKMLNFKVHWMFTRQGLFMALSYVNMVIALGKPYRAPQGNVYHTCSEINLTQDLEYPMIPN